MDVIAVFETDAHHKKASRKLIAVCSSKRAAISLVVSELLGDKIIEPKNIADYRNTLNEQSQTQGLDINYILIEIIINKKIK